VLETPEFSDVFGPDSLAEVPMAATVAGQVIAGTIDRILIKDDAITIVDFKTARRPTSTADSVPDSILKQMAAYALALEAIYPGRTIRAGVLYTQTPQLIEIPQELIALHKNAFVDG
jgi:ATP-dependent helicase/nuclease subunit A